MSAQELPGKSNCVVVEVYETSTACPQQWEGRLGGGLFFYLRWRGHRLGLGIGTTARQAIEDEVHDRAERVTMDEDEGGLAKALAYYGFRLADDVRPVEAWGADPYQAFAND